MALLVNHKDTAALLPEKQKHAIITADHLHYARLNDALEPYARAVTTCWSSCSKVRLYCTVPTCPSKDCDLHDLKDLQSRCFRFIHALVNLLRTSGIYASYHLTFSPTSQVIVRALSPTMDPAETESVEQELALDQTRTAPDQHTATVLLLHDTPVLVVS